MKKLASNKFPGHFSKIYVDIFVDNKDHVTFSQVIREAQQKFVSVLKNVPPNTAKNEALCENTFDIAVCVFNKIPLFVRRYFLVTSDGFSLWESQEVQSPCQCKSSWITSEARRPTRF